MEKKQIFCLLAALTLIVSGGSGCGTEHTAQAVEAEGTASISVETKYIALTFDDGPKAGTTDVLLDGLAERGVHATFFLIGRQIEDNQELVERMAAEGHQVGNHTWNHTRLEGATLETICSEVGMTDQLLTSILGPGEYWLRPPYGVITAGTESAIGVPMVKWSVDPRDWESLDADKVVQAVLEAVEPNSIILLHDIYPTSVEAALRLVDLLEAEGYQFLTVRELLEANGITPQAGVLYRSGNP